MDWKEYNKRRLREEERLGVMRLDAITRSFEAALEPLRGGKLAGEKYLNRDVACVKRIIGKIRDAALKEVPQDARDVLMRQSRDYIVTVAKIQVQRQMDEVIMPMADEWQFVHIVLDSRCKICMNTPGEARACGVRALLRRYTDEPEPLSAGDCGFMGCDMDDSKKLNKQKRL